MVPQPGGEGPPSRPFFCGGAVPFLRGLCGRLPRGRHRFLPRRPSQNGSGSLHGLRGLCEGLPHRGPGDNRPPLHSPGVDRRALAGPAVLRGLRGRGHLLRGRAPGPSGVPAPVPDPRAKTGVPYRPGHLRLCTKGLGPGDGPPGEKSMAPSGQAAAQAPQERHLASTKERTGRGSFPSGLWHHRQSSGQPFKKAVLLIPGPS